MTDTLPGGAPSPLRHTRDSVRAVQDALLLWAGRRLADAGAEDVHVAVAGGDPPADAGPCLWFLPVRAALPGRSGDAQGVPLLVPSELTREPAPVSPAWAELARTLQVALDGVFPRPDGRPVGRPVSSLVGRGGEPPRNAPPIHVLPEPLAEWYGARVATDWTRPEDGALLAQRPSLTWRPAVALRLHYVAILEGAGADVLPLLAALTAALAYENSFPARVPAAAVDPLLHGYATALARGIGGEAGAELLAALARLAEEPEATASVGPSSELTPAQVHQLATSLGRMGGAHLQVSVGVSAGAVASFAPAAVPGVTFRQRRAGGDE